MQDGKYGGDAIALLATSSLLEAASQRK